METSFLYHTFILVLGRQKKYFRLVVESLFHVVGNLNSRLAQWRDLMYLIRFENIYGLCWLEAWHGLASTVSTVMNSGA